MLDTYVYHLKIAFQTTLCLFTLFVYNTKVFSPQEVTQSVGITLNEAEVISSNFPPPLMRICQNK